MSYSLNSSRLGATWSALLAEQFEKDYFGQITDFLNKEISAGTIVYPQEQDVFNAFTLCPFDQVKVVMLGQDPYHNPHQANGLCFSVADGIKPPPSLANIYKEINTDLGLAIPNTGNLSQWAKQGVLMLNASLTVAADKPMSHSRIGWHIFTDAIIKMVAEQKEHVVFLLWGKFAQSKASLIDSNKHLVLQAAHPSPLSAYNGFWGCKHFSKTNEWLAAKGLQPIDWHLM